MICIQGMAHGATGLWPASPLGPAKLGLGEWDGLKESYLNSFIWYLPRFLLLQLVSLVMRWLGLSKIGWIIKPALKIQYTFGTALCIKYKLLLLHYRPQGCTHLTYANGCAVGTCHTVAPLAGPSWGAATIALSVAVNIPIVCVYSQCMGVPTNDV